MSSFDCEMASFWYTMPASGSEMRSPCFEMTYLDLEMATLREEMPTPGHEMVTFREKMALSCSI
jgi:hypothetical protein